MSGSAADRAHLGRESKLAPDAPAPANLPGHLIDKIIEPSLAERVRDVALPLRDRISAGQPIQDELAKGLQEQRKRNERPTCSVH